MKCKWCNKEAIVGEEFCTDCKSILDKKKKSNEHIVVKQNNKYANLRRNNSHNGTVSSKNTIATILKIIGIIILVIGVISLFYNEVVGISMLITEIILSCLFFGFGEIIRLLQKISDKLDSH